MRTRNAGLAVVLGFTIGLSAPQAARAIVISEIMYHPSAADEIGAGNTSLEWVEIYNEEPTVVHLSGWYFSNGVSFVFPDDVYLNGRSYLVVCADEQAVRDKYGITNTIGNFNLSLDNGGETVELSIYGGGPICRVQYNDRNRWPQAPDGTGHSLVLVDAYDDPGAPTNWTSSLVLGGTPGGPNFDEPTIVDTTIIAQGEDWRFLRGTTEYPTGWKDLGFDDSTWEELPTGIGYGDGDDASEIDMQNNYWSFAARKVFTASAEDLSNFSELTFLISYDDGFVAYLNGTEVARGAMGTPNTPVNFEQAAELHEASGPEPFSLPTNLLVEGDNVLAVQIHNNTLGSSDASFVPILLDRRVIHPTPAGDPVPVVINEYFGRTAGERWVELYNISNSAVDLSGFHLSTDRAVLDAWTLPPGSVVSAHGFLSVTESETGIDMTGLEVSFYLTRPAITEVIDAVVFENPAISDPPLAGTSDVRFPDGAMEMAISHTPSRDAPNVVDVERDVVFNEILYHPPDSFLTHNIEFFELYNRGTTSVDLSGCAIDKGVEFAFVPGTTIEPGSYLVVAASPDDLVATHGFTEALGPYIGSLSNNGERLRLVDAFGNVMDEVRYYDGGRWAALADGGGSSLELIDPRQDNSVATAWAASDESAKASWEPISFSLSYAQQSRSEFQIRMLAAGEAMVDALELKRAGTEHLPNGSFESSTSPWRIQGNHIQSHRTTEDSFDGSACLKIIATGDGDTRVNRIETDASRTMSSGTYSVTGAVRWISGGNLIFFSGYRQLPRFQHSHWMRIPQNLGSPGEQNQRYRPNSGPVISEVMHDPAVPAGGATAHIVARVSDADGVESVTARYRTGTITGAYGSVELLDDGLNGDGVAGDGLYGGTLPQQNSGTKVVYYIQATDTTAATGRFPTEAPARTLLFQHGSPHTARSFPTRLIHDDTNLSELNNRQLHSNELLDATFVFNESKVYYNVGTRYRGSPWNRPPSPRMYRIKFGKDDLFRTQRAVNLSRYGNRMLERAAYYSVWRNSTPSSTSPMSWGTYTRVITHQGTATMELVAPVNGDYLQRWFPDDAGGYLMKITGKLIFNNDNVNAQASMDSVDWATYANRGSLKGNYRWNWNFRTRELEDNFTPLMSLMAAINAPTTTLDSQLESIMDVEQVLRVYAGRCAHDDWDTISIGNGQNAYIYYADVEGRFKLLPWDLDHSWGSEGARIYPDADSSFRRVITRPKFRRMYRGILNEMLNGRGGSPGHWNSEEMVSKYLDQIAIEVGGDGVGGANTVRSFINGRRNSLLAQIPTPIEFRITTNGGNDLTVNDTTADLSGAAWVDVNSITHDGEPLPLTWSTESNWSTTVPLDFGGNVVTLIAFDSSGNLVASDTINITSTAGWQAPEVSSILPASAAPEEVVAIEGTEFHDGIQVFFDGVEALSVEFNEATDPTSLTTVVPFTSPGSASVTVRNVDDRTSDGFPFEVLPEPPKFIRGDLNLDRVVEVSDALKILLHLYHDQEVGCEDAGDVDNDESIDMTDSVMLLNHIYLSGPAPAAPYPTRGLDPDAAAPLGCDMGVDRG